MRRFVDHIREVRDTYGVTVIWVEHIISALTQVVDRLVVLEQGSIIADGAPHSGVARTSTCCGPISAAAEGAGMMLEVSHLVVDHGELRALWDVSFRVGKANGWRCSAPMVPASRRRSAPCSASIVRPAARFFIAASR